MRGATTTEILKHVGLSTSKMAEYYSRSVLLNDATVADQEHTDSVSKAGEIEKMFTDNIESTGLWRAFVEERVQQKVDSRSF